MYIYSGNNSAVVSFFPTALNCLGAAAKKEGAVAAARITARKGGSEELTKDEDPKG